MEHDSVGEQDEFEVYNREMCEKQVSPCSTFKIISALMGLKNHVIEDENSTMNYDGTQYPSADWNGHLTLQQAWFVGFEERGDRNVYFAVYLNDAQNRERVSGVRAKEIAQSIVSQAA